MIINHTIPLSLYVHIPWCVKKCPYCDFNSHTHKHTADYASYITHLLRDLNIDLATLEHRPISSIFIGGGTPSLLNSELINQLLIGISTCVSLIPGAEITIEVNPNSAEVANLIGYRAAGINRISMGIQSFSTDKLRKLGRVHTAEEAKLAINLCQSFQFDSFNVDLMHGLPEQTLSEAILDIKKAIEMKPPHISWYQLTIEPNTLFASKPPTLPEEELLWNIYKQGHNQLIEAGYTQYEISSYAKREHQCQHNINYWRFGDYLGIGCGAHGKITKKDGTIIRTVKTKHPRGYMSGHYKEREYVVNQNERAFEFFMNRFRLLEPVLKEEFYSRTFLPYSAIRREMNMAIEANYVTENNSHWFVTDKGRRFLNSLLMLFL